MTDASFRNASFSLMIKVNPAKNSIKTKNLQPITFGSKRFFPLELNVLKHLKEFLALLLTIREAAYILWEATKTTIVPTDDKSVVWFFQRKWDSPTV